VSPVVADGIDLVERISEEARPFVRRTVNMLDDEEQLRLLGGELPRERLFLVAGVKTSGSSGLQVVSILPRLHLASEPMMETT
jgi:hypothetical protein